MDNKKIIIIINDTVQILKIIVKVLGGNIFFVTLLLQN